MKQDNHVLINIKGKIETGIVSATGISFCISMEKTFELKLYSSLSSSDSWTGRDNTKEEENKLEADIVRKRHDFSCD